MQVAAGGEGQDCEVTWCWGERRPKGNWVILIFPMKGRFGEYKARDSAFRGRRRRPGGGIRSSVGAFALSTHAETARNCGVPRLAL